jgi:hypothetical protein
MSETDIVIYAGTRNRIIFSLIDRDSNPVDIDREVEHTTLQVKRMPADETILDLSPFLSIKDNEVLEFAVDADSTKHLKSGVCVYRLVVSFVSGADLVHQGPIRIKEWRVNDGQ